MRPIEVDSTRLFGLHDSMKSPRIDPDQLAEIFEAALSGDQARVRRLASEVSRLYLDAGDDRTAKRLGALVRRRAAPLQASSSQQSLPVDGASRLPLIDEMPWPATPAILNGDVQGTVSRFLHDVENAQKLAQGGLLTRFGLMLAGPPGTGKTLLAGHIAAQLRRPFLIARLDSLISSRLGETAKNIRQIFEFAPTRGAILFLDEIDAIAKMRDDRHELGELKRVVNTVIQGLDSLDDQAVVIAATNHPQLLDPAIWRRFPYRADLGLPDETTRCEQWLHFLYSGAEAMRPRASVLSQLSPDFSGADIENVALAARRLALLNDIALPEPSLVHALTQSTPANITYPQIAELTPGEKKTMVQRAVERAPHINKSVLAETTHMSRNMLYKLIGAEDE